jgi:hypothetical protein
MIAAPVFAFLCILIWNNPDQSNNFSQQNTHSSRQTRARDSEAFRERSTKTNRPEHLAKTPLTPDDDPGIKTIIDQLKDLEQKRTDFCRREESDSEVFFEYLVKGPDPEEVKEINKLISNAVGLTQDQNKQTLTWKQRLSNDFLPSPEFEYCIVGIVYKKTADRVVIPYQGSRMGN